MVVAGGLGGVVPVDVMVVVLLLGVDILVVVVLVVVLLLCLLGRVLQIMVMVEVVLLLLLLLLLVVAVVEDGLVGVGGRLQHLQPVAGVRVVLGPLVMGRGRRVRHLIVAIRWRWMRFGMILADCRRPEIRLFCGSLEVGFRAGKDALANGVFVCGAAVVVRSRAWRVLHFGSVGSVTLSWVRLGMALEMDEDSDGLKA